MPARPPFCSRTASPAPGRAGLLAALVGSVLRVAAASEPEGEPGAASPRCTQGAGSALSELACELGKGLGPLGGATAVAVAPPASDRTLDRSAELATRIAKAVAATLGTGATVVPAARTLTEARERAQGSARLLWVTVDIAGGEIRVSADARSVSIGFWDRVRGVPDESRGHAVASRRLDGEIAGFLPPVSLVGTRVERIEGGTPDVVAASCGDVDQDGALELALVGRRKIQLGRASSSRFVPHAEAPWAALSAVSPSPLREPIAAAEIDPGRGLRVGSTDRERGLVLSPQLELVTRLDAVLPVRFVGCLSRSGNAVGLPGPCTRGAPAEMDLGDVVVDAMTSGVSISRSGSVRKVVAFRAPTGTLTLVDDSGRRVVVPNVGAALAVADLDRDGEPDFVASENTLSPGTDAVVVRSWSENGSVRERLRVPVPDGVRALAACPPDSASQSSLVIATRTALWVMR